MKQVAVGLLAVALAAGVAATASAQTRKQDDVTIRGQRMPGAEAPKSATCEALSRDPSFVALLAAAGGDPMMGPRPYLPTRVPRNPDYSAPPTVPVGTPLPEWTKGRFGARSPAYALNGSPDASTPDIASIDPLTGDAAVDTGLTGDNLLASGLAMGDRDAAILSCRTSYRRGFDTRPSPVRPEFNLRGAAITKAW